MKKFFIAAAAAFLVATGVEAAVLNFPSDAPIATITLPSDWAGKETDTGIEASSADDAIYFYIDVASAKTAEQVVEDSIKFLADNGVTIDIATQKEGHEKLNGMELATLDWDGKDKDGPVSIGLAFAAVNADKLLVITYWGTKGQEEKHAAELGAIIASLKPLK